MCAPKSGRKTSSTGPPADSSRRTWPPTAGRRSRSAKPSPLDDQAGTHLGTAVGDDLHDVLALGRHDRDRALLDDPPAFSWAISTGVDPRMWEWSMSTGQRTATAASATLVASHSCRPMPHLDDRDVHRGLGERGVGQADHDLEERHRDAVDGARVDQFHVRQALSDELVEGVGVHRAAVDGDALGQVDEMRGADASGAQPQGAQQRLDHEGSAALAVCAGDLDDRKGVLRGAEEIAQGLDALQAGGHPVSRASEPAGPRATTRRESSSSWWGQPSLGARR